MHQDKIWSLFCFFISSKFDFQIQFKYMYKIILVFLLHQDTIMTGFHQDKMKQKEKSIKKAVKQSARSELLLQEQAG